MLDLGGGRLISSLEDVLKQGEMRILKLVNVGSRGMGV